MNRVFKTIGGYLGVLLGVTIFAFGLSWFLIPNRIAAGGVSGIGTLVFHLFNIPVGLTMIVLNIPLLIVSIVVIGSIFGIKTVFGTVALSILVDAVGKVSFPITSDPLLAAIYGGVITGLGLGLAFRFGGSTGGSDVAAQLISRFFPISVGQAFLIVDGLVILLAGLFFGPELALYALVALFVSTKTLDLVQEGQSYAKAAFIISDYTTEIGKSVLSVLDRGATLLQGEGVFTGTDRQVLFVIVSRTEIAALRQLIQEIDPKAFLVISDVREVLGEGFKRL